MTPEELLHQGDPEAALVALQDRVRAQPSVAKLRVFLFQLLCILGQWERARTQLKVLSDLDASTLAMVNVYGRALSCETLREEVFAALLHVFALGEDVEAHRHLVFRGGMPQRVEDRVAVGLAAICRLH